MLILTRRIACDIRRSMQNGVWTALISPFDQNWNLDLTAFQEILQSQKEAGVAGVVPCGTTGESPTLTLDEKKALISASLEALDGSKIQVMAGTGSNSTQETVEFSSWASDQGVDAILVVTPYYNKPSQNGLKAHFRTIADAIDCDLVLYNVPGRTAVTLTPESIAELAEHPRIVGVKDATADLTFASRTIACLGARRNGFSLLSGDDLTFLPFLGLGGDVCISVASNLIPQEMNQLFSAFRDGRPKDAQKIHERYFRLFQDLFIESNPVPVKQAMAMLRHCEPQVRLPLTFLQEAHRMQLESTLRKTGILT